jgi:hypothetical protein
LNIYQWHQYNAMLEIKILSLKGNALKYNKEV